MSYTILYRIIPSHLASHLASNASSTLAKSSMSYISCCRGPIQPPSSRSTYYILDYGSPSGRRQFPAASSTGSSRPLLPSASLQDALATRDDAIRGQEEVAALWLQQTQDLHAAEQHLAAYYVEQGRLRAKVSNLRGQMDLTGVNSARIQGLQDQTAHQLGEIQDLERRLTRMTRERDRLQASNDHLAAEVDLAGAEILDLQTEYADIERDLEDSEEQRRILESSLDRVQAALQRAEAEWPRVPDPVVRPRPPSLLIQERDRALASAAEAEARLSRRRAVHNATLVDLDREVAARTSSDRAAEVARMETSDLQGSLQASEETVDALGQRVREIQDQRQAAEQDREDLRLRQEAACRERDIARRLLSMVASIVGASPRTRPEEEDLAALLRLLREDLADTSEHPTPRYLTYGDPLEIPPKDVDPHKLPDPMTSAASKRPREDSTTPDPNSAPSAKRRFASQDWADAKDDHSLSDPANRGGEIDDDGGRISEDHEEGGDSVSDEATTSGGAGSSAEGEDTETAEVADELFEAQTLEALSQSRSAERRR
ncbi:unnamed protein product [Phytophthora fragariaefolia]|uniref:Unnamed protein product n=1 Tax=Phytophthora fragariaefolia TaxID=1490495 RepID=A0A9W6Y6X0_9STRA|nr:unnamed protein product [Phytophthora fragariaefolia]